LGYLKIGQWRNLTKTELVALLPLKAKKPIPVKPRLKP
jgi:hypothetical protein